MTASYPPHLLRARGSEPGAPRRGQEQQQAQPQEQVQVQAPRQQTAAPGRPGSYEPDLPVTQRPLNLSDMASLVLPATRERWPAGSHVLLRNGRHVHWDGVAWRGGDALEGPPRGVDDRSEPEQSDRSEPEQSPGAEQQ